MPCSFYTDTDFTHPSELLSFCAPSVRLIDLAPECTHPHRLGYVLQTFLAQCQDLSPAAWPDIPAAGAWQLLSFPGSQSAALPSGTVCMSPSSCPGVRLQGTSSQGCFLAAAQLWPFSHHEPQRADMSSAQDQSTVLSCSLEKEKHERMEPFLSEVMQSYSQGFFAKAWWFEKFVRIFLPACIKYSGKSSASSNIFLVLCCIWINVSEDCWFSGVLLSY